jgi:UDP-N-acetylglucosamine 2-epimerase
MFTFVLGTKAELIKTVPVMKELERRNYEYLFIHTGHHDIKKMCEEFDVKEPDIVLFRSPKATSKFFLNTFKALRWSSFLSYKLLKTLSKIKSRFLLVHGDTITTAVTSITSFFCPFKNWLTCHLEAGLRSFDFLEPFPEEISRVVADNFCDILFAVSDGAEKNLKKENVKGKIVKTGNTIVDSVKLALKRGKKSKRKKFVLVNLHRNENLQSKSRMKKIVEILNSVTLPIYWPIHDQTKYALKKYNLWKNVKNNKNIEFSGLISYFQFLQEMRKCKFVITDGGSIQEESLILKKPCVILRMKTERVEGLKTGINFLTKLNVEYAKQIIERLEGKFKIPKFKNPYGDNKVSKRIIEFLVNL